MTNTLFLTLTLISPNTLELDTHGTQGSAYTIQASSNMVNWSTIYLYRDEDVSLILPFNGDCQFYRIKQGTH